MSWELKKVIEFVRIDTEWGWFASIALPFFAWYLMVQFLLASEFGMYGRVVNVSERAVAVEKLVGFSERVRNMSADSSELILSINETRDGIEHYRITARLSASNWTYKLKPFLLMAMPAVLSFIIGVAAVGSIGFRKGEQPTWLVNGLVVVNLFIVCLWLVFRFA